MSLFVVLIPTFLQVLLTLGLLLATGLSRTAAIRRREVRMADIALGQQVWPARITQIGNAYANNMQLPTLFYALTVLAIVTKTTDMVFVVMSFLFVGLRYAHAFEHVTSNNVPRRFALFIGGIVVLFAMWVIFAVRIATA
jgi:hypothetical protein